MEQEDLEKKVKNLTTQLQIVKALANRQDVQIKRLSLRLRLVEHEKKRLEYENNQLKLRMKGKEQ